MNSIEKREIRHELEIITGVLSTCFKRLTADRRAKNSYSALASSGIKRLEDLLQNLDEDRNLKNKYSGEKKK